MWSKPIALLAPNYQKKLLKIYHEKLLHSMKTVHWKEDFSEGYYLVSLLHITGRNQWEQKNMASQ